MRYVLFLFILVSLFACRNKTPQPRLFSDEVLAKQEFNINPEIDTILTTLHGSAIRIAAGSFNSGDPVKIVIKEAFTPAEILAAGLTTESHGRPLRSGGMIYINAASNDQPVELIKPIKVSIPNPYYDSTMKIYKGVETDSSINWVEPTPPDSNDQVSQWMKGSTLFNRSCASCHTIHRDFTGPALKHLESRRPWTTRTNLYEYIHNPGQFKESPDQNYSVAAMQAFPNLTIEEMDAILDFIKNESGKPGELSPQYLSETSFVDTTLKVPCKEDTIYLLNSRDVQSFFADDTVPVVLPANNNSSQGPIKAEAMEGLRDGFTDKLGGSGMYDFEIQTLGWYNVDADVEGTQGTSNVKLYVQLQHENSDINVYLFCPSNKMLSVMNDKSGEKFLFNKINGGVPLFLNDRAILFAFGSVGKKAFYGISEFRVKEDQTIEIIVKEGTQAEVYEALRAKHLEGIELGIEKKEQYFIRRDCDSLRPVKDSVIR